MATCFEISADPVHIGYNLDWCEEVVLVHAYQMIRREVAHEGWARRFEEHYLVDGRGISERVLGSINAALVRSGRHHMMFRPVFSAPTAYTRMRGVRKTEARAEILDALDLGLGETRRILSEAKALVAKLEAPAAVTEAHDEELVRIKAVFDAGVERLTEVTQPVIREDVGMLVPLTPGEEHRRMTAIKGPGTEVTPGPEDLEVVLAEIEASQSRQADLILQLVEEQRTTAEKVAQLRAVHALTRSTERATPEQVMRLATAFG